MMEFPVTICIDTQDPELGYSQLQALLAFNGHQSYIRDAWLKNHKPLPADVAQTVAMKWQESKSPWLVDQRVVFTTNDPGFADKMRKIIESGEQQWENLDVLGGSAHESLDKI